MRIILPYPRQPVEYGDSDPRAPAVAQLISNHIRQHLPSIQVEHIGSTAVADCGGRGVIDLMLLYDDEPIDLILATLDTIGFLWVQRDNNLPDEWPKGAGAIKYAGDIFRIHLHVLPRDHMAVSERRAFRDRLQSDPEFRAAYQALKRVILAAGITDPIKYTEAKSDFVAHYST